MGSDADVTGFTGVAVRSGYGYSFPKSCNASIGFQQTGSHILNQALAARPQLFKDLLVFLNFRFRRPFSAFTVFFLGALIVARSRSISLRSRSSSSIFVRMSSSVFRISLTVEFNFVEQRFVLLVGLYVQQLLAILGIFLFDVLNDALELSLFEEPAC